jgi:hypothetical protein
LAEEQGFYTSLCKQGSTVFSEREILSVSLTILYIPSSRVLFLCLRQSLVRQNHGMV